ncbi:MAG TPA: GNAT family protein [Patescibacteria group bacterium]|jgi:ribosomal-protein-alanine N-acetyltransferase
MGEIPPERLAVTPLETERLLLRPVRASDAADVFDYTRRPEVSEFLPWEPHTDEQETLRWLTEDIPAKVESGDLIYAVELKEGSRVIGVFDLHMDAENRKAQLGYSLSPDFHRQGYGVEACEALVRHAFTVIGLNRIEAGCDVPNEASWRLMERLGMKYEGTRKQDRYFKGKYRDSKYYGLLKSDWEAAQA